MIMGVVDDGDAQREREKRRNRRFVQQKCSKEETGNDHFPAGFLL